MGLKMVNVYCEEHEYVHNICHLLMDSIFPMYVALKGVGLLDKSPKLFLQKRKPYHRILFPEVYKIFTKHPVEYVKNNTHINAGKMTIVHDNNVSLVPFSEMTNKRTLPGSCSCSNVGQYTKEPACNKFHHIRISNKRFFCYVFPFADYFLSRMGVEWGKSPNQITIIRRNHFRRILNHDELRKVLSKTGLPVQEVVLEKLGLVEQLRLVQRTKVFVAGHGASLTYAMLLPPNSFAIEIMPYGYAYDRYQKLAIARNEKYTQWWPIDDNNSVRRFSKKWLGDVDISITPKDDPDIIKQRINSKSSVKTGAELHKANKLRGWFRDSDTFVDCENIKQIIERNLDAS